MVLLDATTVLVCPNCDVRERYAGIAPPGTSVGRFHACRGLKGLIGPLHPEGTACKVERIDRDDYVGQELVQHDGDGRPTMSVVTTRDDGMDCIVLAPTAQANGEAD